MLNILGLVFALTFSFVASAGEELKTGDPAPAFSAITQDGQPFALESRRGQWTVLFFYPKAGTPGCTKQACAFRDGIKKIQALGADVIGVSADSVEAQKKFSDEHQLKFKLVADPEGKIVELYGAKMALLKMAKRWTFLIDPALKIRHIEKDVDPVMDAPRMAEKLASLGAKPAKP